MFFRKKVKFSHLHYSQIDVTRWQTALDAELKSHVAEDWGHLNRIHLNGALVARHACSVLAVGDELRLGGTVLKYERTTAQ